MPEPENHYIFIVHGTFNPPAPPGMPPLWYQPGGQFAQQLQAELEKLDPAWRGAVWRQPPLGQGYVRRDEDGQIAEEDEAEAEATPATNQAPPTAETPTVTFFAWSGENTHAARVAAAEELSDQMLNLWWEDPQARIHLIGHSHGGNVILKALEMYGAQMTLNEKSYRASKEELDLAAIEDRKVEVVPAQLKVNQRFDEVKQRLGEAWGERPLADAPELHRVGRVVFLGTPFFYKRWRRSRSELVLRQLMVRSVDLVGWLAFMGTFLFCAISLLFYLPVLGVSALLHAVGVAGFIGFNPLAWPVWLIVLGGVLVLGGLIFLAFLAIGVLTDPGHRLMPDHTNFYFDHVNCTWLRCEAEGKPAAPRVPALVVNAGALDEALVALSSQPLLQLFGRPAVEAVTSLRLAGSPPPPETGVPHQVEASMRRLKTVAGWLNLAVFGPPMLVIRRLLQRPMTDWLMNTLRQVVVSAASGLPPYEVDDADLVVRTRPEVAALDEGEVWDVSEHLAYHRSEMVPVIDPQRYSFFWDAALREARFKESLLYSRLVTRYANNPLLADPEFQRHCLSIEERLRELTGSVEVLHGRYYQDAALVSAIARFIFDGTRPNPLHA